MTRDYYHSIPRGHLLSLLVLVSCLVLSDPAHARQSRLVTHLRTASSWTLPDSGIEAAFADDDYTIGEKYVYEGQRGFVALSKTATTLGTGKAKRVYYVEGSGTQMGYLLGRLAYNETETMVTTYLEQLPLELLDAGLADKAARSKFWKGIYDAIRQLINDILVGDAVRSFDKQVGDFPRGQLDEMQGMVAGAQSINKDTKVTYDRLKTLNYGIDLLVAMIYTGNLKGILIKRLQQWDRREFIARFGIDAIAVERVLLSTPQDELFRPPIACHAYGVRGAWTKSGNDAFMGRDFMLPTGGVFQDVASMIIYVPSDGRYPMVSAGAPGMIGSITSMNIYGVSMGVDILRSQLCNAESPGLNSLMMVRGVAESTRTLEQALTYIQKAARGVSWLYPVCDGSGDCAIVEAAQKMNGTSPISGLSAVTDRAILDLLPDEQYVLKHQSNIDYREGLFIRHMNYTCPVAKDYLQFNEPLFNKEKVNYQGTQWGETGFVFTNYTIETANIPKIMNNYFSPQREQDPDLVLCSNNAISPSMRISQMATFTDGIMKADVTAPQWRYDQMLSLLQANKGNIDYAKAQWIISFITPDRAPGFNTEPPFTPGNEMTQPIGGLISIMDLKNRVITTQGGYWCDKWIRLTLPAYVDRSKADAVPVKK